MSNFSKTQRSKGGSTTARLKRDVQIRTIELLLIEGVVTEMTEGVVERAIVSLKRELRAAGRDDLAQRFERMTAQEIAIMQNEAEDAYEAIRAASVGRWEETRASRDAAWAWMGTLQGAANVARMIAAFNAAK